MSKKRKEVVKSIEDAVGLIKDGQTVAIGGFGADNHPMAIVREIIRKGKKNLTIVGSATAGLEIDLLIGAGVVKKLIAPYVGQEMYCPIGHNYRKYAESGQIELRETSEYMLYAGLFAAASGQEFFAWRGGVGTSIPELNPDFVEFMDPIGKTKKIIAVPPLRLDWAIVHVGWSDVYGNGQHLGARFGDRWLARAANRIMTQTERVVPNSVIRKNPFMTTIAYADVVVEAPYGGHPYAAWGINVRNLYGITEGGYVLCQGPAFPSPAQGGRPIAPRQVRRAEDGELLVRGPGLFRGYWKNEQGTEAILIDGWLHTGDVVETNDADEWRIVDRKKDIMITSGGKNIAPSEIENLLKSSPYISEAALMGDGRKFVCALIEIDFGTVSEWARRNSVIYTGFTSLAAHEQVVRLIEAEIGAVNETLARVEQVKKFRIIPKELDPEEGDTTPTRKVKRKHLSLMFEALIEDMYTEGVATHATSAVTTIGSNKQKIDA